MSDIGTHLGMVVGLVHSLDMGLQGVPLGRWDLPTTINAARRAGHDFHIVIGASPMLHLSEYGLYVAETVCLSKSQDNSAIYLWRETQGELHPHQMQY